MLFDTIKHIVTPASPDTAIQSNKDCENFLSCSIQKVIRANTNPSVSTSALYATWPPILKNFSQYH